MAGKRLKVFNELLSSISFPHHDRLTHLMATGFPVGGPYPTTGIFPHANRQATTSIEDLWRDSRSIQKAFMLHTDTSDPELSKEVFDLTLAEVQKGWLTGPFTTEDLDRRLGKWIPNRRFGVRQGPKVRCIDDFSASGVNQTLSANETVDPDGLDRIAVNARAHMDALLTSLSSRPSSSPFLHHDLHPDHAECRLVSRLWDLEAAYRQLPRAPSHSSLTVIAVFDPATGTHKFFEQAPLAFGASSSVLSFNWVAEAIKQILISIFHVAATNFYDDFSVLEVETLARSARDTVEAVLALLGWRLKELKDFDVESTPLGAILDLSESVNGKITIRNKPERVQELLTALDETMAASSLHRSVLPKLRGRLLFARSLAFGRCGGDALRAIGLAIQDSGSTTSMSPLLLNALRNLKEHLLNAKPREIRAVHRLPPLVFTDGAFEPSPSGRPRGSFGGILLDRTSGSYLFFRGVVSDFHLDHLLGLTAKTAIFELEVLPVLFAKILWANLLDGSSGIFFVDNDAAKAALINSYSSNLTVSKLLSTISGLDTSTGTLSWYERVPTHSNPADTPSRGDVPTPLSSWSPPTETFLSGVDTTILDKLITG